VPLLLNKIAPAGQKGLDLDVLESKEASDWRH